MRGQSDVVRRMGWKVLGAPATFVTMKGGRPTGRIGRQGRSRIENFWMA